MKGTNPHALDSDLSHYNKELPFLQFGFNIDMKLRATDFGT
jgi:hypothetical protein